MRFGVDHAAMSAILFGGIGSRLVNGEAAALAGQIVEGLRSGTPPQ
jgi:hypothetical protein